MLEFVSMSLPSCLLLGAACFSRPPPCFELPQRMYLLYMPTPFAGQAIVLAVFRLVERCQHQRPVPPSVDTNARQREDTGGLALSPHMLSFT